MIPFKSSSHLAVHRRYSHVKINSHQFWAICTSRPRQRQRLLANLTGNCKHKSGPFKERDDHVTWLQFDPAVSLVNKWDDKKIAFAIRHPNWPSIGPLSWFSGKLTCHQLRRSKLKPGSRQNHVSDSFYYKGNINSIIPRSLAFGRRLIKHLPFQWTFKDTKSTKVESS